MQLSLKDKVAVVTGSTSGIGLSIAESLAMSGASIMLTGLDGSVDSGLLLEKMRSAYPGKFAFYATDVSDPTNVFDLMRETDNSLGSPDIVINNAGIQTVAPLEEFPIERWDAIIAVNLSSAFHTSRLAFRHMKQKRWGRIINIASAHGLVASPFKSAYVAAKHGLIGLTKTIALEGAEHGITCNAICPGYVLTPMVQKQIPETAKARGLTEADVVRNILLTSQVTGQFVTVEQIAALSLFLCSPAAEQITGAALTVDGGWTAH